MQQLGFEILLNPSVATGDELRLSHQGRAMYRLFVGGRVVSNTELARIGRQYGARLWELRRALVPIGFCIDLIKSRGGVCFYQMRQLSESSFFADHRHSL
jgi:hypothetical protein